MKSFNWKIALKTGAKKGVLTFLRLLKIVFPVYTLTSLLKITPLFEILSNLFKPFMKFFGLPGDAALAVIMGNLVNLYAAVAVIAGLSLTQREITILALILLISHSQILESGIFFEIKTRFWFILIFRILVSFGMGILLNLIL